ncbi:MAG: hypothetical protein ACXQS8_07655 [Candidatus Helarchaeales archaeon]
MFEYLYYLELVLGGVSVGILILGIFMVFGTYLIGHLLEHGDTDADADHDVDHDFGHDFDHDVDHDFGHDFDHDVDHDLGHDFDHDVDHDLGHDFEHDFDHDITAHSHEFEFSRTPLGALVGIILLSFGGIGILLYLFTPLVPTLGKIILQVVMVVIITWIFSKLFGMIFVETGTHVSLKTLVGSQATATTDIRNDYGEIRIRTIAGYKRYPARPYFKHKTFTKGEMIYIVGESNGFALVNDEYR